MGLLSIIRKQKQKDHEIRVLVLGLDNAGKTTILTHLMGRPSDMVAPTMGFQIHTFTYGDRMINAWDIGGQTTLRAFWSNYFERLNVVIWVIDGASLDRLPELYKELREKVIFQDQLVGTSLAVVANKMDLLLDEQKSHVRNTIVRDLNLPEMDEGRYVVKFALGYTGEGLDEVMEWVTSR